LLANKTYFCEADMQYTSGSSGGVAFTFDKLSGGTLSVSTIDYGCSLLY
jgi:hypothetical protein